MMLASPPEQLIEDTRYPGSGPCRCKQLQGFQEDRNRVGLAKAIALQKGVDHGMRTHQRGGM